MMSHATINNTQSTFDRYAAYYDLLYVGKDYKAEVEYVHGHIQNLKPGASRLLDLGCGTGIHLAAFEEKGYTVAGVDQSDHMLSMARKRLPHLPDNALLKGDIRSLRVDQEFDQKVDPEFDVVVSLFHVMSYQVEDSDLTEAFETARSLLKEGGLFLFDCWYGPGVLNDRPSQREKEFENERLKVIRKSTPEMHLERNVVDVHFDVEVLDKATGETERLYELHAMRYLFNEDIESTLEAAGFEMVIAEEWLNGNALSEQSWNGFFGGVAT